MTKEPYPSHLFIRFPSLNYTPYTISVSVLMLISVEDSASLAVLGEPHDLCRVILPLTNLLFSEPCNIQWNITLLKVAKEGELHQASNRIGYRPK